MFDNLYLIQEQDELLRRVDSDLVGEDPFPTQNRTPQRKDEKIVEESSPTQDFFSFCHSEENSSTYQNSLGEITPQETPTRQRPKRTHDLDARNHEDSSFDEESSGEGQSESRMPHRRRMIQRTRTRGLKEKKGYPTKNFLATYKTSHLELLEQYFGREIYILDPMVGAIKEKNGISLSDYQYLYNVGDYREIWRRMFQSRHLYRAHMISRCKKEARMTYVKKIQVFRQAFITGKFDRIN